MVLVREGDITKVGKEVLLSTAIPEVRLFVLEIIVEEDRMEVLVT